MHLPSNDLFVRKLLSSELFLLQFCKKHIVSQKEPFLEKHKTQTFPQEKALVDFPRYLIVQKNFLTIYFFNNSFHDSTKTAVHQLSIDINSYQEIPREALKTSEFMALSVKIH